jgi:DNA polymerase-1
MLQNHALSFEDYLPSCAARIDSFGLEEFAAKFEGLRVDQFVDMQALMGDQADNIPGVFGIGLKTALKLLKQYGEQVHHLR